MSNAWHSQVEGFHFHLIFWIRMVLKNEIKDQENTGEVEDQRGEDQEDQMRKIGRGQSLFQRLLRLRKALIAFHGWHRPCTDWKRPKNGMWGSKSHVEKGHRGRTGARPETLQNPARYSLGLHVRDPGVAV